MIKAIALLAAPTVLYGIIIAIVELVL